MPASSIVISVFYSSSIICARGARASRIFRELRCCPSCGVFVCEEGDSWERYREIAQMCVFMCGWCARACGCIGVFVCVACIEERGCQCLCACVRVLKAERECLHSCCASVYACLPMEALTVMLACAAERMDAALLCLLYRPCRGGQGAAGKGSRLGGEE
jgi:hypothetical protein